MKDVVWVDSGLGILWVASSGGGVGVPCGVAGGVTGLLLSGELVDVDAVVGDWSNSKVDGADGGNEEEGLEHFYNLL